MPGAAATDFSPSVAGYCTVMGGGHMHPKAEAADHCSHQLHACLWPSGASQQQQGGSENMDTVHILSMLKCRLLVMLLMFFSLSLFSVEKQVEFCCHLARGSLDPNEPLTYEYVKFVVDFKYFTHGK